MWFLPCPQSLLELHKRRKAVTEPEARYYLRQTILGTQYLHNTHVIHRDLKLGNLFLNDDMEVKIGKASTRPLPVLDGPLWQTEYYLFTANRQLMF